MLGLGHIPDEAIVDVHVTGAAATGRPPVQFQEHRACVVLVGQGQLEGIPLLLEKYQTHMIAGMFSYTVTTSASAELVVLIFCVLAGPLTILFPNVIDAPV